MGTRNAIFIGKYGLVKYFKCFIELIKLIKFEIEQQMWKLLLLGMQVLLTFGQTDVFVERSVNYPEAILINLDNTRPLDIKLTWIGSHTMTVYIYEIEQDILDLVTYHAQLEIDSTSPL